MSATPIELDPTEQRILGSLLEKQRTVPASYPLSLNGLKTACNQTASRDPITDLDDRTVNEAVQRLKARELVRVVWAGGTSRVLKFHQLLDTALGLQPDERALITVLLLRGPQSAGELRSRSERLHPFVDKEAVEARLQAMAALQPPLVRQLERRTGQQDPRWIHLLGPVPLPVGASAEPAVDREVVLAEGPTARNRQVATAYDTVALEYTVRMVDELDHKPFDRWLLDRIAVTAPEGPIADVGCGPGQVAAWLADEERPVVGYDLSPAMIECAREQYADRPGLSFEVSELSRLLRPRTAAGWSAITAWYALVHLAGSELAPTVAGLARLLVPGGWLAVAVHVGAEVRRFTEWWGEPVDLQFVFHDAAQVRAAFTAAGLVDIEWYLRGPYAEHEVETDRLYVLGRRPS